MKYNTGPVETPDLDRYLAISRGFLELRKIVSAEFSPGVDAVRRVVLEMDAESLPPETELDH